MELLYLNNIKVDLPDNSVGLTSQINDIAELKDRQADYSNTIKLPKTPTNIKVMGMLGIAGNNSNVPYSNLSVKYVVEGIEIISEGKGVVKNTSDAYNLVIYDGATSLTDLLGNKELQTLDYSSYNHNLTIDTFLNSFTKTDGYIYGLGKFYDKSNTSSFDIDLINVSFYCHTLFDMIFTQKGYSLKGDIFNDNDFKSRVISMDIGYNRTSTDNYTQVYMYNSSGDTVNNTYGFPTIDVIEISKYTVLSTGLYDIKLVGDFVKTYGNNFEFNIHVNGLNYESIIVPNESFDILSQIQAKVGDVISVNVFAESVFDTGFDRIGFTPTFTSTFYFNDISIPINIENLIGSTRQYDFVKEVMQHFGLVFRKTRNKKEFEFKTMEELLNDADNVENWSSKYSNFNNESYNSGYGQLNTIKYNYDSSDNDTELTFANGSFELQDVNLSAEKTLFTSILKASESENGLPIMKHWIDKTVDKIDVVEPSSDGLRMFKISLNNESIYYRFKSTIPNLATHNGTIARLNFESIYYQDEIDKYYTQIKSMLNNYKSLTIDVNLNLLDYYSRDFFKLKYFSQLGKYYYLNKISNFKKGKKTTIEIIEVPQIISKIKQLVGSSSGESLSSAILYKFAFGTMQGVSYGSSTVNGILTKTAYISILLSNGVTFENACSQTASTTYYSESSLITIGSVVYTDISGTILFNGQNLWYKTGTGNKVQINTVGVVINEDICI